jgi:hypothetical protein
MAKSKAFKLKFIKIKLNKLRELLDTGFISKSEYKELKAYIELVYGSQSFSSFWRYLSCVFELTFLAMFILLILVL